MKKGKIILRLKELREEQGLNQLELANKVGMSQSAISFYETEARLPGLDICAKFCDFFGVSIDYFVKRSSIRSYRDAQKLSALEIDMLMALSRMNKVDAEKALAFAKGLLDREA